jgi:1,2-phenylacetyl-CoA epoxidase catalytic subunit
VATDPALAKLKHDVNGQCANLKAAAAQLSGEDSEDELELLRLMSERARVLADGIAAYEKSRRGGRK